MNTTVAALIGTLIGATAALISAVECSLGPVVEPARRLVVGRRGLSRPVDEPI